MNATYNYIYDERGMAEYVVLPVKIWEILKPYLSKSDIKIDEIKPKDLDSKKTDDFNPKDYYGAISHLNLDIDQEIKNIRSDFYSLFGSWQSDETGDELINAIYSARNDQHRDVEL